MKVKGIELFKMIKSGEIKNDTRIKVIYGNHNPIYIFRNYCLYDENNKEMGVSVLLSEKDFEILEDKIEEIEEVDWKDVGYVIGKIYKEFRNGFEEGYTSKETNCMTD